MDRRRALLGMISSASSLVARSSYASDTATTSKVHKKQPPTHTRGILLFTHDIESVPWPKMASEAELTTIGVHPGGGHLKADMVPKTMAWIKSDAGQKFLRECREYGIEVEYEIHALRELLPRALFKEHPEYFRVDKRGKRSPDLNFCFHSEEALRLIAANAIAFSRVCKPTTGRYFFWLDDKPAAFCHCEKCKRYSASEQSLIYENFLLKELRKFDSEATLSHLCYLSTLPAPRPEVIKPDEGIFLEYAPIRRSYTVPYKEQKATRDGFEHLLNNLKVFPVETAQVLEYWMDVTKFSRRRRPFKKLPWRQDVFESDVAFYRSLGVNHVTSFGNGIDKYYVDHYGQPPLKQYGPGLKKHFSVKSRM